jgi:PST family polysaccharide transporter
MKKLFQTTILIGFSQIFIVAIQLVRAKIVAVLIGPMGVGVLGNTSVFLSLMENICFLGLNVALLRQASEAISKNDFEKTGKIFSTVFFIHLFVTFLAVAGSLLLINRISASLYQDFIPLFMIFFVVLTIPLVVFRKDFGNLFNAFNDIKLIARVNVIPSIVSFCSSVPLIIFFGVKGAIASIFLEALLLMMISILFFRHYYANKVKIKRTLYSKELAISMLQYGGVFQIAVIVNTIAAYSIRLLITEKLFLAGAGIFNAALSIGSYLLLLQTPLGVYLYPKVSSIHENKQETEAEINRMLRFFLIILVPATVGIILFSDVVIKLLLSGAFLAIGPILVWILAAKFFEIIQLLIGTPLFIMKRFKAYLSITVIFNIILVGLSYIFLERFNLFGVAVAQSFSYALLFIMYLAAAKNEFNFKLEWVNVYYIITGLCLFFIANYFRKYDLVWRAIPLLVTLIWLIFGVKRKEWLALSNYVRQYLFAGKKRN